ncbi:pyridoxal-phosphate-dependent aminotransferase family protein [Alkalicoccobacillus gibsonii]|uniref:pyridoxal-phosphate-dependent aminotransferase family protein n=1 Tax=Alkalicoccobacillus gibsonii TaxID=79881 RepID=UPI003F7C6124
MYQDLSTPLRTILTPGPVEVDPRVLRVMSTPIVGQFDPAFTKVMNEVMEMLRQLFQTKNQWAFPVDGTSRSGIEAMLCSVIHPGDVVLVPVYGRFGNLLIEICERYGATVKVIEKEWGSVFEPAEIIEALNEVNPDIVALVHAETSTGRMQPLKEVGEACRKQEILFIVDAVASIGGADVNVDEWCIDGLIAGTQKCLSVPSGLAPLTYNKRVEERIAKRKKVERGIATEEELKATNQQFIRSNYFDLSMLQDYWGPRRLNHHTEATSMLYALREGLRLVLEEGLEERFNRHAYHEKALMIGLDEMGLERFGDDAVKLPTVTCIKVPEGVEADEVRHTLLEMFGIEIASSFGPLHGKIWRIGTMGYSCRRENILAVLGALEGVLVYYGVPINKGRALEAAIRYYAEEQT